MKAIFHIHTRFSKDASLSLERLFSFCLKNNIKAIMVSDHNTIKGGLEAQKYALKNNLNIQVLVASEIATQDGEIIGVFLKEEILAGLTLQETIKKIKEQGGIVYLPHPFDSLRRERIKDKNKIEEIMPFVDIVEGFNSRNLKRKDNQKAFALAKNHQKPVLWGCDAHFAYELKNAIVEIPPFNLNPQDFLHVAFKAKPLKQKRSFLGFFQSILKKYLLFKPFILIF